MSDGGGNFFTQLYNALTRTKRNDGGVQYIQLIMQENRDSDDLVRTIRERYKKEFSEDELKTITSREIQEIPEDVLAHVNFATVYLGQEDARNLWGRLGYWDKMYYKIGIGLE